MSITNGYTTVELLKSELGIPQTNVDNDVKLEAAIAAASRQCDAHTGRRFWQDGSVVAREFYAESPVDCETNDISTTTGLIVKVDSNDDGTFATTLTINTDFILLPLNVADMVPVWPYTALRIVNTDNTTFPWWTSGRPGVQVTAKFGWPAVPDDVAKACLIQATQMFKASDAVFGGLSFGDAGFMRVRGGINPMAEGLLEPYCKPRVA